MKNNIDYQKLYKKSEFINLISGFEYTTVELNEDNKYVIVDKETNSELTDEECLLNTNLDDLLNKYTEIMQLKSELLGENYDN
ncbi:hypothetical protein R2F61_01905 [Mollicutes bacterium LVI A0078]|nr:hypothetical protein RZE84_01915 [Mollicutes bacterium LVI A0075]WOO90512.1 hypothetical protein R2F61_07215 [Mollicutes bacterium LVI A0078]WOO91330.1 hypothetical protein R2F61_01905 [Mollicutes bacterium LVI A0078]